MLEAIFIGVLLCIYPIISQIFEAKVVNGEFGLITEYSYSAFLNVACTTPHWTCGSSILNQYILLTAAHCLFGSSPSCISVTSGNANRNDGTPSIVSTYRIHPRYTETSTSFDIGLIKLMNPLIFGVNIGRVALMQNPPYNETGIIAGWGFVDEIRHIESLLLKYTTQEITSRDDCQDYVGYLPAGVFCGGSRDQDSYASLGDSGSALVVKGYIQVGLVSSKLEQISRSIVIYTDVGYYFNWIKGNALLLFCGIEH